MHIDSKFRPSLRFLLTDAEFEYYKRKSKKQANGVKGLNAEMEKAIDEYNSAYEELNGLGEALYAERIRSTELIEDVEGLINTLENHPEEQFDTEISKIKLERKKFIDVCELSEKEFDKAKKSAIGGGAGAVAGAAIASVAPTAAMWVATTFGTASTGTAISALSGAAATKAALAWLGGGALAAGGGGMAAGSAFLALAGPIGWTVAGASILSSVTLFAINKKKIVEEKKSEIYNIKDNKLAVKTMTADIKMLYNETTSLKNRVKELYNSSCYMRNNEYNTLSNAEQKQLCDLINNTKLLATSLNKNVG